MELHFEGGQVLVPAFMDDPEQQVGLGDRLKVNLEDLLDSVAPVIKAVRSSLVQSSPDEVTLTLKVGVAISAGKAIACIADGRVDGAIELALKWKNS